MASELELEIHQHLSRYLDGREIRYEFENWLLPVLWDLAESTDESARQLAGHISSLISETSYADRSQDSLREELTRIARPFVPNVTGMQSQSMPSVIVAPQEIEMSLGAIRKPPNQSVSLDSFGEQRLEYRG